MIDVPARVRDALRDGRLKKNYKFKVLNDDGSVDFTIDNNTLVSETVKFDERMCSGDTIKFGLCEGSSLEFQYFDHESIRGRRIYSEIEVEYIDATPSWVLKKTYSSTDKQYTVTRDGAYKISVNVPSGVSSFTVGYGIVRDGVELLYALIAGAESQEHNLKEGDIIRVKTVSHVSFSDVILEEATTDKWYTIPMGFYEVDKCPMQYSTGIRKVTAYNKLKAEYLDQKANEIIKQIFADGVAGCDTSIDISILLEILLNDYQIESEYKMVDFPGTLDNKLPQYTGVEILQNQTNANYYVIIVTWSGYITQYPTSYQIPEDPYYREPDWYYTGYLKWWANTKAIYQYIQGITRNGMQVESHVNDTYKLNTSQSYYTINVGTLYDLLRGAGTDPNYGGDYFTFCAEMVAGQGSVTEAKVSITPDNLDLEGGAYSPIIKGLKTMGSPSTVTNVNSAVRFRAPMLIKEVYSTTPVTQSNVYDNGYLTAEELQTAKQRFEWLFTKNSYGVVYLKDDYLQIQRRTSPVSGFEISYTDVANLPDVTLRELQSALFEVACQYGQIDRVSDLFYGKELNNSWLYPRDDLYPANNLYPGGGGQVSERGNPSAYKTLWTDSSGEQSFRNLIITYKGLDENNQAKEFTLTKVVSASGTTDYICKDNWVFKNLVWDEEDIDDYADAMVAKLQEITWIPFEMWAAGLPYLETGDEIEITNKEGTFKSYVLQRVLSGIQNLQDTYINGTLEIF